MKYDYIFWDLDGTLTNSYDGIRNALRYMFDRYGITVAEEAIRTYIGPPLTDSFSRHFAEEKELREAIGVFRSYYCDKGVYENCVYDGIRETLAALKARGYKMYTATTKQDFMAKTVAEHFGLDEYIDGIFAAREAEGIVEKEEVLAYALNKLGADANKCLLIGDTVYDLHGARIAGTDCMIVKWGFGDMRELEAMSPEYIVDKPSDIVLALS